MLKEIKTSCSRYECAQNKYKLIRKLIYPIRKNGIKALRTDDIAKYMDVSKATLYKYFSSKYEIIEALVEMYIAELLDSRVDEANDEVSYIREWQKSFKQGLLSMNFISESFQNELRESYPELLEKVKKALNRRYQELSAFYNKGIEFGIFNYLNPTLVILQDEAVFRNILDPAYLLEKNLTIHTAIKGYYECKRIQVIKAEYQNIKDDAEWEETIEYLVQKVSSSIM
jgi:Transcriptional regulator